MAVVADRRASVWWRSVVAPSAWRQRGAGDGAGGGLEMAICPPLSPAAALAAAGQVQSLAGGTPPPPVEIPVPEAHTI
jgi:hypothetical protein